jgi:hypothetical protein
LFVPGTPAPVGPLGVVDFFLFWPDDDEPVVVCCGCDEERCLRPPLAGWGPVGLVDELVVDDELLLEELPLLGAPLDGPEVEPEVEVELLLDEVVLDELVVEVVVVVVVLEPEPAAGAQVSLSDTTVPVIGRPRLEIGVPGAALTLKVYVWPPRTVTVTVQASAEALPNPTAPSTARVAAVTASTTTSFPLVSSPGTNPRPNTG